VGCAVDTVRRHLALEAVPKYERKIRRTAKLAAHEVYHLRERRTAARPDWIPADMLHREIVERGYWGGRSQLRTFMRSLRLALPGEPKVCFEMRWASSCGSTGRVLQRRRCTRFAPWWDIAGPSKDCTDDVVLKHSRANAHLTCHRARFIF
jgi:hypothetical protein